MSVDKSECGEGHQEKITPVEPGARVLVVGGSDPSGASGIQADLRTLTALGVYGASAVTALTVQNQYGVTDIMPLSASFVGAQIDAALGDAACEVVKTGMLASVDIVQALVQRTGSLGSSSRLVLDPVLQSSSGRSLLSSEGVELLLEKLVPAAALVTPNIPEATRLTGVPIANIDDMGRAIDQLLARGAGGVLLKGGHLVDVEPEITEITDILRTADGEEVRFSRPRIKGPVFRGTGCTLASAVAGGIAEGFTLQSSVQRARDYIETAMKNSAPYRAFRGLGWVSPEFNA